MSRDRPASIEIRQNDPARRPNLFATVSAGLGASLLGLACCLCGGGLFFFQPEVHDDPSAVPTLMDQMLDVTVPATFAPGGTIEWNVATAMSLRGAYYEYVTGDGVLMFIEVQQSLATGPDVAAHVDRVLHEKTHGAPELVIDDQASDVREVLVQGELRPFQFDTASDPATEKEYRLIGGVVSGRSGPVLIRLRVPLTEEWNDATAVAMLESVR